MLNQTSGKRLIQLLAITFVASLLLTGVASAEILGKGTIKGVEYCHDPLNPNKAPKTKIKDLASYVITRTGTVLDADIDVFDKATKLSTGESFVLTGNILANKNPKAGVFQLFGVGGPGTVDMAMNGKYKQNSIGEITLVSGAFQSQDLTVAAEPCLSAGKFKAKTGPVPAP
jgi:hypothetical protein